MTQATASAWRRRLPALGLLLLAALTPGCDDDSPSGSSGAVSDVAVSANPSAGSAETTFTFTAVVSTNGAAEVSYQWERDTGELGPVQTLSFTGASSQSVAHGWRVGGCSTQSRPKWVRVIVISPNRMVSRQATFTVQPEIVCL
jgi:hypothetical protein